MRDINKQWLLILFVSLLVVVVVVVVCVYVCLLPSFVFADVRLFISCVFMAVLNLLGLEFSF